ncbi:MAG: hypothetical protein JKY52_08305 [Flavobacteriales bacterium]|nr:hypothetical protein [Flavobacteriales bacterium]
MDAISIGLSLATKYAPGLIRRFGGDTAGDVADSLFSIGKRVTGLTNHEDIQRELDQNVALRAEFQKQAAQLDVDLEKAYLADRQNARQRDIAMMNSGKHNWRGDILAFASIAGLIAALAFAFFIPMESGPARDLILILGGALITIVKDVYGFEFGSSRGSKEKDAQLSRRD